MARSKYIRQRMCLVVTYGNAKLLAVVQSRYHRISLLQVKVQSF